MERQSKRKNGILLHISSLPSPYGIGSMGQAAYEFVDFLAKAGQKLWQVLPLGPTGFGNSPYQSYSTFAGNPWFIDLDRLAEDNLLYPEELYNALHLGNIDHVDYPMLEKTRMPLLLLAASRGAGTYGEAEETFYRENADWLPDYALFTALKAAYGGAPCWQWPEKVFLRDPEALEAERVKLADMIKQICFIQFLFHDQWVALKNYANYNGVELIGDLPIYVAEDSADVWSHPELFMLDEKRRPIDVAGVPTDAFSDDGQLWGNPLYAWEKHKETGYAWWTKRLEKALERHDVVRIDHFRGFAGYYAIPAGSTSAKDGEWRKGPSLDLFEALGKKLDLSGLIAEDLGVLDDPVRELLAGTGFPGMKVLEFGFDSEDSEYLVHNYPEHCIAYVGTHDNETFKGWLSNPQTPEESRKRAVSYLRINEKEGPHWAAICTLLISPAERTVLQMQDVLGLGNFSRMNTPSTLGDHNWTWRVRQDRLTDSLAIQLRAVTHQYGRC